MVASQEPEGGITGWVVDLMESLGSPGAGLAVALENLFPPLPSEVILPLAGFTASQGGLNVFAVIGWTTLGSVIGAVVLYLLGAVVGRARLRTIAERLPLVDVSDVDRSGAWFGRHGGKAVFFGRFIPVFRSLISIPAGVERMPVPRFLIFTALGSAIWNTALIMVGYLLGENWRRVEPYLTAYRYVIVGLVVVAIAMWVVTRLTRRTADKDAS